MFNQENIAAISKIKQYLEFMDSLEPLFAFSRHNCVAICSFLVPANLIATIATLVLVATEKPLSIMGWSLGIASASAITLFLHVSTWFMIGVITPVTFILFTLGTTCLLVNILAVAYRREITQLLGTIIIPPLT
ncbi:MAG: hypothetical protein AAF298_03860 [Cyanobacteria bacterium P01_A01_bin.40]